MEAVVPTILLLEDQLLPGLVPDLLDLQLGSRTPSTLTKCKSGWLRWRGWASSKIGVPVIPAKPLHIAMFITELTHIRLANNTGVSAIEAVVYKQLLGEVFVISRIIKVEISVISRSRRLRLITLTKTLVISDITKAESNNCFVHFADKNKI